MKKIILISGKQGSGKTTLADGLQRELKNRFPERQVVRTRFAKPLYEMHDAVRAVAESYGIPMEMKEGVLLQLLGTEWGRKTKGDDVWVYALKNHLEELPDDAIVIIDDCRFRNELFAFTPALHYSTFKVRLTCDEQVRKERAQAWRENTTHQSETDLDTFSTAYFDYNGHTDAGSKADTLKEVLKYMSRINFL